MPLMKNSATALVLIQGLGIMCFNPSKKRCETALLRQNKHSLAVNIYKPLSPEEKEMLVLADQEQNLTELPADIIELQNERNFFQQEKEQKEMSGEEIPQNLKLNFLEMNGEIFKKVVSYSFFDNKNVEIEIKGIGKPIVDGYRIFQNKEMESFIRDETADVEDFRWIVDLEGEELHNEPVLPLFKTTKSKSMELSKLFIENGEFYTHDMSRNEFHKVNELNKEDSKFGKIANTIGAKIEAEVVSLEISVNGEKHKHLLPENIGFPYIIEVANVETSQGNEEISDMVDYYNVLQLPQGKAIFNFVTEEDLQKPFIADENGNPIPTGDPTNFKVFCHLVYAGKSQTIENL